MKPRKENETDEEYIKRLEDCNRALKANNDAWAKQVQRVYDTLRPAAAHTGMVLNAAAEITGIKDDPMVKACAKGLDDIAGCLWNDDHFEVPLPPEFPWPDAEKYGGDAEMVLSSALELCKANKDPWDDWTDLVPQYKGVDPKDLDWQGIADLVFDALSDLEFCRGMLRQDLRSAMYDHCFQKISIALREASVRVEDAREKELGSGPHERDELIPF